MSTKLFIDDIRIPPDDLWRIVRSSDEAIDFVKTYGIPHMISFDHDLGGNDTSMVFVDWLIIQILDGELTLPADFSFSVHSANPVGTENLSKKLSNFIDFHRKG